MSFDFDSVLCHKEPRLRRQSARIKPGRRFSEPKTGERLPNRAVGYLAVYFAGDPLAAAGRGG